MRVIHTPIVKLMLAAILLSGFVIQVEAKPPEGVLCTKHHVGGQDCWDNCTKNGVKISGSLHSNDLWLEGDCNAIMHKPGLDSEAKEEVVKKGTSHTDKTKSKVEVAPVM